MGTTAILEQRKLLEALRSPFLKPAESDGSDEYEEHDLNDQPDGSGL